jgi:heptaprenyl diphosphate synthase
MKAGKTAMLTRRPGREGQCGLCRYDRRRLYNRRHLCNRRRLALLGSLCFFLSALEYLIPKPLPFMRIGLANMPLLLALDLFSPGDFFLLALLKILGQGIIGGMIFSHVFLFSLVGTLCSALVMFGLRRLLGKNLLGFAGLGCAGAVASNCAQLLLARYLIFGPALRYLAAPFLASGLVTGIGLGLICEYFCRHSAWYNVTKEKGKEKKEEITASQHEPARTVRDRLFNSELLFIAGLLMALIFLFNRSMEIRVAQFLFFCLLAFLSGKKINLFAAIFFMAGIVFFHLLVPFGKVLAVFGPMRVTQGSLYAGIDKAVAISGLVILSRACVKSDLRLPGNIGSLLGESLRILELMRERRGMIKAPHIISGLDTLMIEMETINLDEPKNTPSEKNKKNIKSILLLIAMVLITAGMNFIPHS